MFCKIKAMLSDAEVVAVRSVDALATSQVLRKRQVPELCSIVCIYVKQHQTLPINNLVFDPLALTYWFCF